MKTLNITSIINSSKFNIFEESIFPKVMEERTLKYGSELIGEYWKILPDLTLTYTEVWGDPYAEPEEDPVWDHEVFKKKFTSKYQLKKYIKKYFK